VFGCSPAALAIDSSMRCTNTRMREELLMKPSDSQVVRSQEWVLESASGKRVVRI
jgi:hypothetical protein